MTQFPWKILRAGQEIYFPEGARRYVSVSVEQIGGDGRLDRAIDGSAIWLGDAAFRRHAVTLSCQGHTAAPVFDVWPGQLVTLEAPVEFAVAGPSATLDYDPVAGSVYGVDADDNRLPGTTVTGRAVSCAGAVALRYRPVMQCVVASRNADKTQNRADAGWTLRLEDLSGAEEESDVDTVTFASPGLQNYSVGTAFSLSLAGSVTATTGLPVAFAAVSGSLPAGLTMNSAGVISGTPTAYGVSVVVVRATSGTLTATQTIPFYDVLPTISSNGVALQNYAVGTAYSLNLNTLLDVTGTSDFPTFALILGTLPAGLSLSGGVLSGTPTGFGAFAATFSATLPTGQTTEITVAFFAQSPDGNQEAIFSGGTSCSWTDDGGVAQTAADFTVSGTFNVTTAGWANLTGIGGGGAGGNINNVNGASCGGGGAGQFLDTRVWLAVGTYTVYIAAAAAPGTAGNSTTITGPGGFSITLSGGGAGAGAYGSGGAGASGGGGSWNSGSRPGGAATSIETGTAGGNGHTVSTGSGGGGGFASPGEDGNTTRGGAGGGGVRKKLWIWLNFCGGGGGGGNSVSTIFSVGRNGGGNGGTAGTSGGAATANTGSGGGGGGHRTNGTAALVGGAGASGRFIVWTRA